MYSYIYYTRVFKKSKSQERSSRRRYWVRDIYQKSDEKGEFNQLVKDIKETDPDYFKKCFRMSPEKFDELLKLISPDITKQDTKIY